MRATTANGVRPEPAVRRTVLYCVNRYRTYDRQMYEALARAFELRVLWVSPPPPDEPLPKELGRRFRWTVVGEDSARVTHRDLPRTARMLRLAVREARGADLVISPTSGSWKARVLYLAARLNGVPFAVRTDMWRDEPSNLHAGRLAPLQRHVTGFLERRAAGVLANGVRTRDYLLGRGLPADKIHPFRRLHADLADLPLDPTLVRSLRERKGARLAFVYLGRVMPRKGLVPLIRVFRSLLDGGRDATLFVVGGPITEDTGRGRVSVDYYEEARTLAAGESRIVFFGHVPPADIHNYYAASDVFVHPHLARVEGLDVHEPWGNVITEAASMSLPIIATDRVIAACDVVQTGVNGYLLDAEQLEPQLRTAMAELIDQPGLAARLGAAARRTYTTFADPQVNIDTLNRVIDRAGRRS